MVEISFREQETNLPKAPVCTAVEEDISHHHYPKRTTHISNMPTNSFKKMFWLLYTFVNSLWLPKTSLVHFLVIGEIDAIDQKVFMEHKNCKRRY